MIGVSRLPTSICANCEAECANEHMSVDHPALCEPCGVDLQLEIERGEAREQAADAEAQLAEDRFDSWNRSRPAHEQVD